jgi:hypothetical protein
VVLYANRTNQIIIIIIIIIIILENMPRTACAFMLVDMGDGS